MTEDSTTPADEHPSDSSWSDDGRFDRQERFVGVGPEGQARLRQRDVLIVGCGALGGSLAQTLARAGVGRLRLADRDVVEVTNLPRQVLFDAEDAARARPKVEAAANALARIGGPTRVETHAVHVDATNLAELAHGVDLILDGTDNLTTRYRINDHAVRNGVPWIYAGVVGGSGLVLPVIPGRSACLRCLFPDPAPPGSLETCDSAGVVLPAVAGVAALEASLALRWLAGESGIDSDLPLALHQLDFWNGSFSSIAVDPDPDCPACARGEYDFLDAAEVDAPLVLCGRNAVQLPPPPSRPDVERLVARLEQAGVRDLRRTPLLLRFEVDEFAVTVFNDGRAIVEGTEEPARALTVYDRFLGS